MPLIDVVLRQLSLSPTMEGTFAARDRGDSTSFQVDSSHWVHVQVTLSKRNMDTIVLDSSSRKKTWSITIKRIIKHESWDITLARKHVLCDTSLDIVVVCVRCDVSSKIHMTMERA
ncbi:Hypothetical predicted protein [Olea europaea subsp. europaea]|uniref:Uncharacterized protein n=1 Tax=Olea europaea subsp. europaea TaxID=158383 RepID=A0A8S0QWP9_OLEEU|nr:Hypothetical predicted protein [Olea europaea subsp. europaea]